MKLKNWPRGFRGRGCTMLGGLNRHRQVQWKQLEFGASMPWTTGWTWGMRHTACKKTLAQNDPHVFLLGPGWSSVTTEKQDVYNKTTKLDSCWLDSRRQHQFDENKAATETGRNREILQSFQRHSNVICCTQLNDVKAKNCSGLQKMTAMSATVQTAFCPAPSVLLISLWCSWPCCFSISELSQENRWIQSACWCAVVQMGDLTFQR